MSEYNGYYESCEYSVICPYCKEENMLDSSELHNEQEELEISECIRCDKKFTTMWRVEVPIEVDKLEDVFDEETIKELEEEN